MKRSLLIVVLFVVSAMGLVPASVALGQGMPAVTGITVTGVGIATGEAEAAEFQIVLIGQDAFMGPPPVPQAEATPGAAAQESVAPIVDALEGADGVESVIVAIPSVTNPYGGPAPVAVLTVTMTGPTQANVTAMVGAAGQAAIDSALMVGYVGAVFTTSECGSLVAAASTMALDDATRQAGDQAGLLNVGLGDVVGTSSAGFGYTYGQPAAQHGCEAMLPVGFSGPFPMESMYPQFDPALQPVEIQVVRQVTVTFAMGASEATPAG